MSENTKPNRNGRILLIMLTLFGAPYLFAWYFFFSGTALEIGNSSNKGNLVSPIRAMPETSYQLHNGNELTKADLQGHWLMISLAESCDELCEQALIVGGWLLPSYPHYDLTPALASSIRLSTLE